MFSTVLKSAWLTLKSGRKNLKKNLKNFHNPFLFPPLESPIPATEFIWFSLQNVWQSNFSQRFCSEILISWHFGPYQNHNFISEPDTCGNRTLDQWTWIWISPFRMTFPGSFERKLFISSARRPFWNKQSILILLVINQKSKVWIAKPSVFNSRRYGRA